MNKRGPYKKRDVWLRFWEHIDPCRTDGCYIWTGKTTKAGYGMMGYGVETTIYTHWFLAGQPLKGLHTDHVRDRGCLNRTCANPEHLEVVTPGMNMERGDIHTYWSSKTHCKRGHPYSGENLRVYRGSRFCRACQRILAKEWELRHQPK